MTNDRLLPTTTPASTHSAPIATDQVTAPPPLPAPDAGTTAEAAAGDVVDGVARSEVPWRVGELHDVGPAGPASAHESGVIMITRQNRLLVARRSGDAFSPVQAEPADFRPYARAPALLRGFAYWVNGRELLRQRVSGEGQPEVLARDARHSTRVATAPGMGRGPALAAYIAETPSEPKELVAMLWIESRGTRRLTPDGSAANSVALVESGSDLLAVSLDAHLGMTPVNARRIRASDKGIELEPNRVAWVGAGATPLTELFTLSAAPQEPWAFVGIQRDISHFGLAQLPLGATATENPSPTWLDYKNGIDPAPLATATVCERSVVAVALPSSGQARAPQELRLGVFGPTREVALGDAVARSRAFSDVSLGPMAGGAVVSYVADRRTWALVVRCPSTKGP